MSYKFLFFALLLLCSCQFYGKVSHLVFEDQAEESLSVEETNGLDKVQCPKRGDSCSEHEDCKAFCDDLFIYKKGKEHCWKWPYSAFKDFKKLKQQLETLSFADLDFSRVKCFFEMSKSHRISLFKNFSKKSAEIFLAQIAINEKLAKPLYQADKKDFNMLEDLFDKVDRRFQRAMSENIFHQSPFLTLSLEYKNQPAQDWADSFIRYKCKKTTTCQQPLEFYCDILEDTSKRELENLFERRWFEIAYKRDIEAKACYSRDCEYGKISDFKEFCKNI